MYQTNQYLKICIMPLQRPLIQVYKSLIPEYAAPVYNLANQSVSIRSDPAKFFSLRLVINACLISPKYCLYTEAAEPTLSYRRIILMSKFCFLFPNPHFFLSPFQFAPPTNESIISPINIPVNNLNSPSKYPLYYEILWTF